MLFLIGVVIVALRCGRRVAVVSSFLSVATFDFFCVPPYLTFAVADYQYVLTFAGMLAVALVISSQAARLTETAALAKEREALNEALYRLSQSVAAQTSVFQA